MLQCDLVTLCGPDPRLPGRFALCGDPCSRIFGWGSVSERPKVQHSKCCVVSQPPWVQIPALPPLPPGPDGAGRFCCARWRVRMRLSVCWGRAACCARGRRATWLMVLLVVLLVFGCRLVCLARPGCLVCPWPAARPRAVRAASFARRVAAKPSQAPPPPTGTAARPSGPSGTLHTGGACVAVTSPARPYRMGTAAHGHRSHACRSCGVLHACGVGISPLCNGLQVGGDGSLWHEELADGVSPTCRSLE